MDFGMKGKSRTTPMTYIRRWFVVEPLIGSAPVRETGTVYYCLDTKGHIRGIEPMEWEECILPLTLTDLVCWTRKIGVK